MTIMFRVDLKFKSSYLRLVGGSTWHWEGTVPRFLPEDFRLRTTYGIGVDWPLDYETLEPFYMKAEKELGVAGDSQINAGAIRSGPYPMPAIRPSYLDERVSGAVKPLGLTVTSLPQAQDEYCVRWATPLLRKRELHPTLPHPIEVRRYGASDTRRKERRTRHRKLRRRPH